MIVYLKVQYPKVALKFLTNIKSDYAARSSSSSSHLQALARLSAVVVLVCLAGIGNILVILSVVLNRFGDDADEADNVVVDDVDVDDFVTGTCERQSTSTWST